MSGAGGVSNPGGFSSGALNRRSLSFYWRAHLGVLLGAAVGTAVLVGALVVGDSVRFSLHQMALARLGRVLSALGGLIAEDVAKTKDKVPVLGDIPLLGRLFRSESFTTSKKTLVIFVTPMIVDPAGNRVRSLWDTAPMR